MRGRLRKEQRLHIGISIVTFSEGHPVTLGQIDQHHQKQFVHFGNRLMDWMYQRWADEVIEIIPEEIQERFVDLVTPTTGDGGHATTTGYRAHAAVSGQESIAGALGKQSHAKGALGCWLVLVEWDDYDHIRTFRRSAWTA